MAAERPQSAYSVPKYRKKQPNGKQNAVHARFRYVRYLSSSIEGGESNQRRGRLVTILQRLVGPS